MIPLLLLACAKPPPAPPKEAPTTSVDTSVPSETADTAESSSSTWETPPALEPDILISGDTGSQATAVWLVGDVNGDGLNDLAVRRANDTGIFFGPLPSGTVSADTVDATFPYVDRFTLSRAGDTDGDGTEDLWWGWSLYRGPFVGPGTDREPDAWIDTPVGEQPVGGFDADGDGHLDVAIINDWLTFNVHYGPFDGARPGSGAPGFDPTQVTQFVEGSNDCMKAEPYLVGPLNALGEVVLMDQGMSDANCNPIFHLVDVAGPRGRVLGPDDAVAWGEVPSGAPVPDLDGDGLNEVLYRNLVISAPVTGYLWEHKDLGQWTDVNDVWPIPDITGDGLGDLVLERDVRVEDPDGYRECQFFVLPGTALGDQVSATAGLYLTDWSMDTNEFDAGDLDGDGLAELIGFGGSDGEVRIWRGTTIRDAMLDAGVIKETTGRTP